LDECSSAHGTRLDGDVQLAVKQAVIADNLASVSECNDFGVGAGVFVGQITVVSAADNFVMENH
jgi:hypothetical protein